MEPRSDNQTSPRAPDQGLEQAAGASAEAPAPQDPATAVEADAPVDASSPTSRYEVPSAPVAPAETSSPVPTILAQASSAPGEATLEPLESPGQTGPTTQAIGSRGNRFRWAIALGVIALVAVASIAGAFVLGSASQSSLLVGAAPKNSVFFMNVRTDMPGDQRQKVAELLAHFPGFKDQSLLDQSIAETLDKAIRQSTDGKHDYSTEVKPWLGSEVGLAVTPASDPSHPETTGALLLVDTKDAAKAQAWVTSLAAPGTLPDEQYAGVTLHRYKGSMAGEGTVASGVVGQTLMLGDETSVKAAIDAKQHGGGLDTADSYKAAAKSVSGDHLATVYVDAKSYLSTTIKAIGQASPSMMAALPAGFEDRIPAWFWASVRAESNSLVVDMAAPKVAGAPSTGDRVSVVAPKLPGSTVGVLEVHDLGTALKSVLDELGKDPSTKAAADQIRLGLATFGGVDNLLGWLGDTALAVTRNGSSVDGGLVVHAPDAKTASDRLNQIKSLLVIGGSSAGLTVQEEPYAGTTITRVDLTQLMQAAAGQAAGGTSPFSVNGKVELDFAAQGEVVVFGVGDGFVKSVLDTKAGSSLADSASYKNALAAAGSSNAGQMYLDIGSIVDAATALMPADQQSKYATDIKPYVDPIDAFAFATKSGDPGVVRFVLTVK